MKKMRIIFVCTSLLLFFTACNSGNMKNSNKVDENVVIDSVSQITMADTSLVSDKLRNVLLVNELELMADTQRRYSLDKHDLNGDGKVEYFVGFSNNFLCEVNGCTYFILNSDGSLNSRIVDSYAPFTILSVKTNGWNDLLVNSNSALRELTFDKKSYPSHPWNLRVMELDSTIINNTFITLVLEGKANYTF